MVRLRMPTEEKRIIDISPTKLAFSALTNLDTLTPLLKETDKHQWLFRSLWDYVLALEIITREFSTESAIWEWAMNLFRGRQEQSARRWLNTAIGDEVHRNRRTRPSQR